LSHAPTPGWFETALCYEGPAILTLADGDELEGTGRLEIDEELRTTLVLRVTDAGYKGPSSGVRLA
jgi:hypothetical protein